MPISWVTPAINSCPGCPHVIEFCNWQNGFSYVASKDYPSLELASEFFKPAPSVPNFFPNFRLDPFRNDARNPLCTLLKLNAGESLLKATLDSWQENYQNILVMIPLAGMPINFINMRTQLWHIDCLARTIETNWSLADQQNLPSIIIPEPMFFFCFASQLPIPPRPAFTHDSTHLASVMHHMHHGGSLASGSSEKFSRASIDRGSQQMQLSPVRKSSIPSYHGSLPSLTEALDTSAAPRRLSHTILDRFDLGMLRDTSLQSHLLCPLCRTIVDTSFIPDNINKLYANYPLMKNIVPKFDVPALNKINLLNISTYGIRGNTLPTILDDRLTSIAPDFQSLGLYYSGVDLYPDVSAKTLAADLLNDSAPTLKRGDVVFCQRLDRSLFVLHSHCLKETETLPKMLDRMSQDNLLHAVRVMYPILAF